MRVFTLGTSNRKPYDFTKILSKYGIEVVFDVRRFPTSQFPQFNRDNLQALCQSQQVEYIFVGNELGGYRQDWYKDFIKTEEFKRGVEIIKRTGQNRVSVILCAELLPDRCHRRFIAEALAKQGVEITHIIDENRIWHPETEHGRKKIKPG